MEHLVEQWVEQVRAWPGNLFSAGDRERLEQHAADALVARDLLEGVEHLVDVGSGGGVPGLVLAAACPDLQVDLIESQSRKCAFLLACVRALGLESRVNVRQERAEQAGRGELRDVADVATARALAAPAAAAELLAPLVRPGGRLLLWTTRELVAPLEDPGVAARLAEQLGLAPAPRVVPAPSPLRDDGVLLEWGVASATPERFPRRDGVAARRPLA